MLQTFFSVPLSSARKIGIYYDFVETPDATQELHWKQNASRAIPEAKLHVARGFLAPLIEEFKDATGVHLLDGGCGEGAHIKVLDTDLSGLSTSFAVDLTHSALDTVAQHASPAWEMIRADILDLPIKDNSLDGAVCFGVLHLTPDPKGAVMSLARTVKPGGLLGVWIYAGPNPVIDKALSATRAITRLLGDRGTLFLANCLVPFYGLIPTRSGLSLRNASWRQVREVAMSNFAPPVIHRTDTATLRAWFEAAGCDVVLDDPKNPTTVWGRKRAITPDA